MEKRDEKKIDDDTKRLIQKLVKKEGLERALKKLGIEEGIMKGEKKKINYGDFELLKTLVGSGHILSVIETKCGNLFSISFEHDDHILKIWNPKTGKCIATKEGVNSVIETKSGNLVSANKDNTIKIWDPNTGECIKTMKGHTDEVNSVIETKSGLLVSASDDHRIKIWNPNTGKCIKTIVQDEDFWSEPVIGETKSGNLILRCIDEVKILDPNTGKYIAMRGYVKSVKITKSGLLALNRGTEAEIWNPDTGQSVKRILTINPIISSHDTISLLRETKSGKIIIGNIYDGEIYVYDPNTGERISLEGHTDSVWSVIETNSGKLVSTSKDKTIKIWNLKTRKYISMQASVNSVIETKSGFLVSANEDNTIKIWDPNTGECIKTLKGHTAPVNSVIETKSGLLVSASDDHTIKIWGEKQ